MIVISDRLDAHALALTHPSEDRARAIAAAAHHVLANRHDLAELLDRPGPHPTPDQVRDLLQETGTR